MSRQNKWNNSKRYQLNNNFLLLHNNTTMPKKIFLLSSCLLFYLSLNKSGNSCQIFLRFVLVSILLYCKQFSCVTYAQNNESRVLEIKKMYSEVKALETNIKIINCERNSINQKDKIGPPNENYNQTFENCHLPLEYSYLRSNRLAWEFGSETFVYKKNNKIFFIWSTYGTVCQSLEYRIYFNENQKPIKFLKKINSDCSGEEKENVNLLVKEIKVQNQILSYIKYQFDIWKNIYLPF